MTLRVVVDALGAPATSGGMRLHAEEVVRGWAEARPDDELVVIGYRWVSELGLPGVRVVEQPEGGLRRVVGQWVRAGLLARRERADLLVSMSPVVSPLFPAARRVATVHDWRHRLRAAEFSRGQRLYRRSWEWSIGHAGHAAVISAKTRDETRAFVPRARVALVPSGTDHPRRWPPVDRAGATGAGPAYVLTFGHFVNKRPDLVLRALAAPGPARGTRLVVLGARGEQAAALAALADDLGVGDLLDLPGFVPEADYRRLVAGAAVLVMASTDEGFGLPVVEAAWFGVPCVVTDDGGLPEIHGDRVRAAAPEPAALAEVLGRALQEGRASAVADDERTASGPRWRDTVEGLRALARPR